MFGGSELFPVFFLGLFLEALVIGAKLRSLVALALKLEPRFFEPFDDILKAPVVDADYPLCARDDLGRKSELLRNGKGVRFSGRAYNELIGRLERLDIEFAGGVLNAVCVEA